MNDHIKLDEEEVSQRDIKPEIIEIQEKQLHSPNDNSLSNEHHQIEMKSITEELNSDANDKAKTGDQMYLESPLSPIPDQYKKTFFLSVTLFLIGSILIIIGVLNALIKKSFKEGLTFWVLGLIVFTPGGYYTFQFYRYKTAKDIYEKEEILGQIPEL